VNIVIDTSVLVSASTGVGTFVYESARALAALGGDRRYTYFDGRFRETLPPPGASGCGALRGAKRLLDRFPAARGLARHVARRVSHRAAGARSFDFYWEPNYIPLELDARRLVVTVHDLSPVTHPEWHPKDRVAHFRRHFAAGLARADVITADSEFTRGELADVLGVEPARVRVVTPGHNPELFRPREIRDATRFPAKTGPAAPSSGKSGSVPDFPFVLAVGSMGDPRKNFPRLFEAWELLSPALRGAFRLVVTGRDTGYLAPDELARLYASASALAYPSLYEGFGLPPLEAMACGTPVVTSNLSALPEVVGDAGVLVDPQDVDALAVAMWRILSDEQLRASLIDKGFKRAAVFSWDKAAQETLSLYHSLA